MLNFVLWPIKLGELQEILTHYGFILVLLFDQFIGTELCSCFRDVLRIDPIIWLDLAAKGSVATAHKFRSMADFT